ncbi:MAG: ATP-binding protein [Acidobacteria bacterium]|nr:ATP-binding protein [Acidobacteriota bacterium]
MKFVHLGYIDKLRERLEKEGPFIQVLLGPRQVGKTTSVLRLIEEHFPDSAIYVSTDDHFNPDDEWLAEQWLIAAGEKKILFVDEIQKIFNWPETIKRLYDNAKRRNSLLGCVLLGSSSLEIQKGLTESLTGRFQLTRAHHWNFHESAAGYGLDFDEYLRYGGYPGSYPLINDDDWADYVKTSIVETVVEKDILQFQNVRNPALFRQAFEILISYPAQEISYTKLLGQLQDRGNVEVVKHYLKLYEGAFLIKHLEKFSNKKLLQRASAPKIVPLAPCLPYLQIRTEYKPGEKGRIFEALVGSQLIRTGEEVFYWREGNNEVDYVLRYGRDIWAIEVKSGRKEKRSGLLEFQKRNPNARLAIINQYNYQQFEKDPILFLQERF